MKRTERVAVVGALRKHAGGMFLASDLGGYAAVASIWICTATGQNKRRNHTKTPQQEESMMDSEKRLGSEELVDTLMQCGNIALGCGECQFKIYRGHDAGCIRSLMTAAADRLEEYVDRCARFSEEIMELRERLQKIEQPGGCAFAPWCDAVREQRRWIPVEERLPERNGPVLVYYGFTEGDEISEQRFFGVMDYYAVDPKPHFQHDGYRGLTVTHWRPLPPAPEDA